MAHVWSVAAAIPIREFEMQRFHLGTTDAAEWDEFAGKTPHGRRLDLKFPAKASQQESTLLMFQDDVKLDWIVELNERKLGKLFAMEAPLIHALRIPPGTLRDGENVLSIVPPAGNDDIVVGEFRLSDRSAEELLTQGGMEVQVADSDSGEALPCRITIVTEKASLAPLHAFPGQNLAARPGVVYTGNGKARIGLLPGRYTVYVTRGFEYGLDQRRVEVSPGEFSQVNLKIRREVPTPGLVSSDTHVHTLTYSRHGDATADERALTLAGEGIELPILADHEYLTDLSENTRNMRVEPYFTPVIGCETTTAKGHFNSFPIQLGSRVPDFRIVDWPKLMETIRGTPGVQVVVLNHPRNVHHNFQPFASTNFNPVTGENLRGFEFSFDAVEVVNSSALQSNWRVNFHDWFALLNYGYRVTGVGSSDGHDVSRYIVGQGRTYVAVEDSRPGEINVDNACESFLRGRAWISMGLLTKMQVNGRFSSGDLATGLGEEMELAVTVYAPSWIEADRVELYANGEKIRDEQISGPKRQVSSDARHDGVKARFLWKMPRPRKDVHLIALATGPGVKELYWGISKPYQSSSRVWKAPVIGATNPIWIDGDNDGKFKSARAYAKELVTKFGKDHEGLLAALNKYDPAVAAQAASLCRAAGADLRSAVFQKLLPKADPGVQKGFQEYLASLVAE